MKVPGIEEACPVCGLPKDWPRGHPKCRVELIGPAELNTIRSRVRSALGVNKYARLDWDTMFRLLGHIAAMAQLKDPRHD